MKVDLLQSMDFIAFECNILLQESHMHRQRLMDIKNALDDVLDLIKKGDINGKVDSKSD